MTGGGIGGRSSRVGQRRIRRVMKSTITGTVRPVAGRLRTVAGNRNNRKRNAPTRPRSSMGTSSMTGVINRTISGTVRPIAGTVRPLLGDETLPNGLGSTTNAIRGRRTRPRCVANVFWTGGRKKGGVVPAGRRVVGGTNATVRANDLARKLLRPRRTEGFVRRAFRTAGLKPLMERIVEASGDNRVSGVNVTSEVLHSGIRGASSNCETNMGAGIVRCTYGTIHLP